MSQLSNFCHHLAGFLYDSEWHFTTLLASCIDAVGNLPDDVDSIINQLLLAHPVKPGRKPIEIFLAKNATVRLWFRFREPPPKIVRINLNFSEESPLVDEQSVDERFVNEFLPKLKTTHDVAEWLEITDTELDWLVDLWRHDEATPFHLRHYHYNLVPKRDGSYRLIESPKVLLKQVQRKVSETIINHMPVHDAAHGFVKGKSCQSHATLHTGKKYLIHFDLANCFSSMQWPPIFSLFRALGYSFSVSKYLTGLCSHQCYMTRDEIFKQLDANVLPNLKQPHLPQGAPSSPGLSNAVLVRLDKRLAGLAQSLALTYSRYADDFVFSGNHQRDWQYFAALVGSICLEEGFALNYRKTRLTQSNQRQKITGIVVNEKLNIDRRYYDRLKAILTNCVRHGIQSQNRYNHENFEQHLTGCIQHVKSLNTVKGKKLALLFDRIECN